MNFLGLIFRCKNGKFVKVEKEGIFELSNGMHLDGYAGHEITKLGNPTAEDYIIWSKTGKNLRDSGWDLLETRQDVDPARIEESWPKETI